MPQLPDKMDSLLDACRRGDRRAQEAFYRLFFPRLLPLCQRYLRNREEAVAILNQAMLRIFQSLGSYQEEEKLEAWLATITRRTVLNFIRDEGRARRRFFPEEYAPPVSVGNQALDRLAAEDILKLLQALPDYLRIVFSMAVIDGYPHAEIAAELEITVAASRWRLTKARELLRGRYDSLHQLNKSQL
ncbi:MAG: RNA polymerase sigma factor [Bacteroidota bacterium]